MLRLLLVLVLVNGLVTLPHWILSGLDNSLVLSLEALIVVGISGLFPRGPLARQMSRWTAVLLVLLVVLAITDAFMQLALGRLLNLYLDVFLIRSVYELLLGNFGLAGTVLIGILILLGISTCMWILSNVLNPNKISRKNILMRAGYLALAVVGGAGIYGLPLPMSEDAVVTPLIRVGRQQTEHFVRMLKEREIFTEEIRKNQTRENARQLNLNRLKGTNVFLAFVESYGMSAISNDLYGDVIRPRLIDFGERMETAGVGVVSGSLVAPSQGGQSWYGHASLLSGLWVDNQLRYDLLLAENPKTLVDDFKELGHETVALMPAITRAWPEGQRFGYDQIFTRGNIEYSGPSLNWVTMPDQFTWSFLQNNIRQNHDGTPLFVELGLISSHAPWTPILQVYDDWSAIGNGEIFMEWEGEGPTPQELWADHEEVRKYYGLSLDYAINTMIGFAERYMKEEDLLIVLGDHQAAPMITGEGASKSVPIHVMSKDRSLLEPFLEKGFISGPIPEIATDVRRMDSFRSMFLEAYSRPRVSIDEDH